MIVKGKIRVLLVFSILVICAISAGCSVGQRSDHVREAKQVLESLDPVMGDWKGIVFEADGSKSLIAAQVIALGGGKYQAN
ncbi:MAG: hypothetical protein ACYTBP_12530, partial [Planctomycetota bacterium]